MISRLCRAAAAALVFALAGCASEPLRQTPGPMTRESAPSTALEGQAAAFESFMRQARGIDPGFTSAGDVNQALQVGAAHDPAQLQAGMVAYAALAALQEPGFAAAVRREGQRGDLARRLAADPQLALDLPGGKAAASRAGDAILRQGQGLAATGAQVKRAAYSVQRQSWSKVRVADPAGRLARVKRLAAIGYRAEPGDTTHLRRAVAEAGARGGAPSPVVTRGVALAALSVLGESGRGRDLMTEPRTSSCLRLAKLNLYQCLASAGPQYEDIYCLGQHALIDTGQCVADAARAPRRAPVTRASSLR